MSFLHTVAVQFLEMFFITYYNYMYITVNSLARGELDEEELTVYS